MIPYNLRAVSRKPTLAACWAKNRIQSVAAHGKAPAYLSHFLSLCTPNSPLWSETKSLPRVSRCRLERFGRCCFACATPYFWNTLPTLVNRASSTDASRTARRLIYLMCSHIFFIHLTFCCKDFKPIHKFKKKIPLSSSGSVDPLVARVSQCTQQELRNSS